MLLLCGMAAVLCSGCASCSPRGETSFRELDKYPDHDPYWFFEEGTIFYSPGDPNAWFY